MEEKQGTTGLVDEQNEQTDEQNLQSDEQNTQPDEQNDENLNKEKENSENNDLYGAPESYDFKNLELPEGVQYNEEYGNKFASVAKELNLSQKSANKLINVYVDIVKSQTENVPEALKEIKKQQVEADVAEWDKLLNQDTEIGNGNEEKINQYMDKANIGYKAFASEGLKKVLSERGLTHNPDVIKLFYKLSDLTGEDGIIFGSNKEKDLTPAQILYGKN